MDLQTFLGELSDWAAAAGPAPQTCAYGDGPEQVADLLLPDGDRPSPVAMLLHGGFCRARFTRATMAALAVDLRNRGWATWNVEYRRIGNGGGVPETLDDVRAATKALMSVAAPLDRRRLVAIAHSAGGQLALCTVAAGGALLYMNRFGQEVWRELRGIDAGHAVPQFSIHRGALQGVVRDAVVERLGPDAISTSRRLADFGQDGDGVSARFVDSSGATVETVHGAALVGADGIHSTVRSTLARDEGPPHWNGTMLWRGATDWPVFLTGRSMIIAGGMEAKVVIYPIGPGSGADRRLTNWAVMARTGVDGAVSPRREDWSRPGRLDDVLGHARRFSVGEVDVRTLIESTPVFYEYPVCDRDPLAVWSDRRVTLLGDAAHAMYPVGCNGASQAILDARALADALADTDDVNAALRRYDEARRGPTSEIVHSNRRGGPEGVIDAVESLAPDGFDDVEAVLPHVEREAIVRGYALKAGFAVPDAGQSTTTRRTGMPQPPGPDVIGATASVDDLEWHILGQIYRPKQVNERSFSWHATLPADTSVPPHIHPTQDALASEHEVEFLPPPAS